MTIRAKTLIKNKFWIVEENGQKLGTLQKKEDNGWVFLNKTDKRQVYITQDSLFQKFGFNIFLETENTEENTEEVSVDKWDVKQAENFDVHGYPCSQKPYNPLWDVQKNLPLYTKTPKSKSMFCAGYYIVKFETVNWRKAYCPKIITLQRYPYKGPIKSKTEMVTQLNEALKNSNETN
jgi:hypothetical protein